MTLFKVGDRVKHKTLQNLKGTVSCNNPKVFAVEVIWDDSKFRCGYLPSELELLDADAPAPANRCDCGGWSVGAHSHWCSNPQDNVKRRKGLAG